MKRLHQKNSAWLADPTIRWASSAFILRSSLSSTPTLLPLHRKMECNSSAKKINPTKQYLYACTSFNHSWTGHHPRQTVEEENNK